MKLFFASHSSEMAGAEQSLLRLVSAANERGHDVTVSVPRPGPLVAALQSITEALNIRPINTHMWMGRRSTGVVGLIRLLQCAYDTFAFVRVFRRGGFDVLVVNSSVIPSPLLAAAICRMPRVLIVRETIQTNPTLKSALPRSFIRWLSSKLSTATISVSQFVAEQYVYPSNVIYPQIDPVFFHDASSLGQKQSTERLNCVMLGNFTEEKGQSEAIEAIGLLSKTGTRLDLDIYGTGASSYRNVMQNMIEFYGVENQVTVHPATANPKQVLQNADISLVCSKNEAFGKVTAESVLVGTPVVGYKLGGTSEILSHGGGVLVEPNATALAAALKNIDSNRDLLERHRGDCNKSRLLASLESTAAEVILFAESQKR